MTPYLIGLALLVLIVLLIGMACASCFAMGVVKGVWISGGMEKAAALLEAQAAKVKADAFARAAARWSGEAEAQAQRARSGN